MKLAGKVALVTGAAKSVGQGIALALAKSGASVVVNYNVSPPDETMRLIEEAGGQCIAVRADVSNRDEIKGMYRQAVDAFGKIDILVNNSAIQLNLWLLDYNEEQYDEMMAVNMKGYWMCIQEVLPYMKGTPFGRILNVTSIHCKKPTEFDAVYSMTKGAVKMLTREAALELGKYGITVNALELGAIRIDRKSGSRFGEPRHMRVKKLPTKATLQDRYPSGRVGLPSDAGYLAVFLAAEESQYINGASIRTDGGILLT